MWCSPDFVQHSLVVHIFLHNAPKMTDNEYKTVVVYRMLNLNSESSVAQTLHHTNVLLFPLWWCITQRDGVRVYQTHTSSACSLSPWFKLAAKTALSFRQVERAWACYWQWDAVSFNLEVQSCWQLPKAFWKQIIRRPTKQKKKINLFKHTCCKRCLYCKMAIWN